MTLHVLREHTLRDVPATLRGIADAIEQDRYGQPHGCVLVLDARAVEIFYMGLGEAGTEAAFLLHLGAHKMANDTLALKDAMT